MRITATSILFLAVTALLQSCKREPPPAVDYKYNYFPLTIGHTVEYYVDSVLYNPLFAGGKKNVSWQVKEVVESEFKDNAGRDAFRIERYIRPNDSAQWTISNVWYAVLEQTRAERVEENLRFIRMVFPPKSGTKWNGNIYIPTSDTFEFYHNWSYTYTAVDEPTTLNGFTFDSSCTVIEVADSSSLIDMRYSKAIYAKHVGLIYKDLYDLRYQDTIPAPPGPWEQKANRGYITRIRIKDY